MKTLAERLQQLSDSELADCCASLAAVESKQEGMYLGETVQQLREAVGDEAFYQWESLLNAECRKRWYKEHCAE